MLLVLLWLIPSLIFAGTLRYGWQRTWAAVGVPSAEPAFLDLRVITSGVVTLQRGGDPLVNNPFDPLHRALNYPRIWLVIFSALGIDDHKVIFIGLLFSALFLTVISSLILRAKDLFEMLALFLAGLSRSSFYAFERGNIDLLIFCLVYLAAIAASKTWKSLTLALATILKIYPLAALLANLVKPTKKRLLPLLAAGVAIALLVRQLPDLKLISHSTPVSTYDSFGAVSIRELAASHAESLRIPANLTRRFGFGVQALCYAAAVAAIVLTWSKFAQIGETARRSDTRADLFDYFAAIYVFTFAIGSNWDYRLIFLVPTIPFSFEFLDVRPYRWWSVAYLILLFVSLEFWTMRFRYSLFLLHLAALALFVFLIVLLAQRMKSGISDYLLNKNRLRSNVLDA